MAIVDMSKIAIRGGRYSRVSSAAEPPGGLPHQRGRRKVGMDRATVIDPYGNGRERIQVLVNRNVDVLEQELSAGRISEAAYETGRIIQEAFQHVGRIRSSSNWGDGGGKVDAQSAAEFAVVATLDRTRACVKLMDRVGQAIGFVGARFLRSILVDSVTFAQAAAARGRHGRNAGTYAGERFRDMLEDLSTEFGAKGKKAAQILASFAEEPDTVHVEPSERRAVQPIAHGQSTATKAIGKTSLTQAVEDASDNGATAGDVVRRGILPRG